MQLAVFFVILDHVTQTLHYWTDGLAFSIFHNPACLTPSPFHMAAAAATAVPLSAGRLCADALL